MPLLLLASVLWFAAACSSPVSGSGAHADEPTYSSIAEIRRAADVVLLAEITGASDGRSIGEDPDHALVCTNTQLRPIEVFKGAAAPQYVLEQPVSDGGRPFVLNGVRAVTDGGTRAFWFLLRVDDPTLASAFPYPTYVTVSTQGRVLVGEDGETLTPSRPDGPLGKEFASYTADGLSQRLRATA